MDITEALAPNSDQLDAIELVEPRTFTIDTGSRLGKRERKVVVEIRLVDFDRVWRPSKGMLDVLAACWGKDGKQWVGRRVTLYRDENVMYGREKRGGTRISHLSHIDGPRDVTIRASGEGRTQQWHVEPLAAPTPPRNWIAELEQAGTDLDALRALHAAARTAGAGKDVLEQIAAAGRAVQAGEADAEQ
ncbi:hypothetical protein [Curtobacterium sp. MCBA15_004]|uniref:hypothetical protein n=1 Tax=Curtobacterium sp. MCBA15_004 TaxID=1898733 RepID=UPI000921A62B|nr:hypothetical protein [Curtobacterium sp. MCBA15_004]WIA95831.1 hypothetical protein QOL16_12000 [Curtobacterium sp. MCBA15_004]